METRVTLVFCYPIPDSFVEASCFVYSYHELPPEAEHDTIVVCNGGNPSNKDRTLFSSLPNLSFFQHDDSGWDIGAFQAVARAKCPDMMFCLGGNTTFRHAGWLRRIVEAWDREGPGMYGTLGSVQYGVAHLATTGFACPGSLICQYPKTVTCREDRSEFEHGPDNITVMAERIGLPVRLVTPSGVFGRHEFRKPKNGLNSGDQSDCLVNYTQTYLYDMGNYQTKKSMNRMVSGL